MSDTPTKGGTIRLVTYNANQPDPPTAEALFMSENAAYPVVDEPPGAPEMPKMSPESSRRMGVTFVRTRMSGKARLALLGMVFGEGEE